MAFYRMSGSSKGELHGASILVTVDGGTSGETVTLTKGTFSKSGVLSDDGTCLFTDLLEAGTYTATYQTFTASVDVSASDILNKVTKSVTIAMSTTITLTLEGAKEDNITITDASGVQVGVCVFPTDSVTGTVDIEIPPKGGVYTFTSSVAKDTTTGTNNYSKNVTLTKSSTRVVVMPNNCLYWYGNEKFSFSNEGYIHSYFTLGCVEPTHSKNSLVFKRTSSTSDRLNTGTGTIYGFGFPPNSKIRVIQSANGKGLGYSLLQGGKVVYNNGNPTNSIKDALLGLNTVENIDLSPFSGVIYIFIFDGSIVDVTNTIHAIFIA